MSIEQATAALIDGDPAIVCLSPRWLLKKCERWKVPGKPTAAAERAWHGPPCQPGDASVKNDEHFPSWNGQAGKYPGYPRKVRRFRRLSVRVGPLFSGEEFARL